MTARYLKSEEKAIRALYPTSSKDPNRSLIAIKVHAQKRHLHRTREAKGRQIIMGRGRVKENEA